MTPGTPTPEDRVDALLRSRIEPLPAAPDTWGRVRRRAGRRRAVRRAAAVAAVVTAVAVVGVPTAVVVGRSHPAARVPAAATPTGPLTGRHEALPGRRPVTVSHWQVPHSLSGFSPASVSFVSQADGYLLGHGGTDGPAVLARTHDAGGSWKPLRAPTAYAIDPDTGIGGVRFASTAVGYLFGDNLFETHDAGRTWIERPDPGRITDLELADGRMWALAEQCASARRGCDTERLYTGLANRGRLRPVGAVPPLRDAAASLSVAGDEVSVLAPSGNGRPAQRWWTTDGGKAWHGAAGPCRAEGAIATLFGRSVDVVCADEGRHGDRARQLFTLDHLAGQARQVGVGTAAPPAGRLAGMATNGRNDVVLADGFARQLRRRPFAVSTDAGRSWQTSGPPIAGGAGFVAFISTEHVVALSATGSTSREFLASRDGGLSWRVTRF